jgi:predicted nucleotidyltransferase
MTTMHPDFADKLPALASLCRRFGVRRLELFGSAAGDGTGFDPARSDIDFLVTFLPDRRDDLAALVDLKDAMEALLGRPVDLIEREAVEASRNFIRRRRILAEAERIYG